MVYNPFNVLLWFAQILFGIFMLILVKDICDVLVVSLPGFGISVKVFKIYSGLKKKKNRGHGFDPWSGKNPHASGQLSP